MEPFFIKTFWITVIMVWVALIILYLILTNEKSLRNKGHSEKYIAYLRKSHTIRIILIAVVLPLLILLSAWLVTLMTGSLQSEQQLAYIVIVLILLVVPFKFLDERINQRKIRELAIENREQVAIDLNFRTLHLVFRPAWELMLGPAALLYGLLYLRIEQWIIYLFLLFPWFMYLNIRGTRYQTRPYMSDNYTYMFAFNIFSFLFFLVYFTVYYYQRLKGFMNLSMAGENDGMFLQGSAELLLIIAGGLLILGLTGRIAVYLSNYRTFVNEVKGKDGEHQTPPYRKWLFFVGLCILVPAPAGLAVFRGDLHTENIEVGLVEAKYAIDLSGSENDTLFMQVASTTGSQVELYPRLSGADISLTCEIRLSRSGRVKSYEVCCPGLFTEIPVGTIVKYRYGPGPSVEKLVEY